MKDNSTVTLKQVRTLQTQVDMDGCHNNKIQDLHVHKTAFNTAGKTQTMTGIK